MQAEQTFVYLAVAKPNLNPLWVPLARIHGAGYFKGILIKVATN